MARPYLALGNVSVNVKKYHMSNLQFAAMLHLCNTFDEAMTACHQEYASLFEDLYLIFFTWVCCIPVVHTRLLLVNSSTGALANIIFELFNLVPRNEIVAMEYMLVSMSRMF